MMLDVLMCWDGSVEHVLELCLTGWWTLYLGQWSLDPNCLELSVSQTRKPWEAGMLLTHCTLGHSSVYRSDGFPT